MAKAIGIDLGTTDSAVAALEAGKPAVIISSEGSRLTPSVVAGMVRDAQSHSEDDRRRREEVEARNNADSMAYQVERQIKDLGDKVPVNEKARAEQLISEIRKLIKNQSSDIARLRQLSSDLQQVGYGLSSAVYSQSRAAGAQSGGTPGGQQGGDDDVIDADFKKT